ncbi:MAG: aldolase catalytic domain-containing protein [Lachnospiraceae bacterium]|nr:aldolase catalytic domain-containing protein [Lachnospiraceae bacterium]
MANIRLLDCTLRDGGYINDWNFGKHTIQDILAKLVESNVDYVEVGFLRDCEYEPDKSLFNNCAEIANILPENRGKTKFTAMSLHNKYSIDKLEPYDGKTIDAIRVTFHDYDIDEGLAYIRRVKEKGYKVFVNPINIMGYSDEMILQLLKKVNELHPYAFSIVDTFGSMMKDDLLRIYSLIEHNLSKDIVIGLHLHENLALSYSLAQDFINMKASDRECVIDASMLGMGRSPGNLCMELIMDYMNKRQSGHYDVNPVLDGIDDHIARLKQIEAWGYDTAYAISAKYNLHRNYAEFLLDKGRLRAKQINQILGSVEAGKKTAYDEAYIERLYQDFQNNAIDDAQVLQKLSQELAHKNCLILAPGPSILEEKDKVAAYIEKEKPVVLSANFVPDGYHADYVFCCNAVRLETILGKKSLPDLVITSNLLDMCEEKALQARGDKTEVLEVNYMDLSFRENEPSDNSVIMLLRLLKKLEVGRVALAGFDGYHTDYKANYVADYMASQHTKGEEENKKIKGYMEQLEKQMEIQYVTKSLYH